MSYLFKPYKSIGPIYLGKRSEEIREIISDSAVSRREKYYETELGITIPTTDYFVDAGVKVEYNEGLSCFIEIDDRTEIMFQGRALFNEYYRDIENRLREEDEELIIDGDGLISRRYGLSVYSPNSAEARQKMKPELISVFARGYYDEALESGIIQT